MTAVPGIRIRALNSAPLVDGAFVLYWMMAFRRTAHNFALDRAAELARERGVPLVVLEALRCDYPWASDRHHAFVLRGMADNAAVCAAAGIAYHPYVEPAPGAGRGLLGALAERACAVVADDYPAFFLPRMLARAASMVPCRMEAVDSNGVVPMRAADRVFPTCHGFRRFVHDHLDDIVAAWPSAGLDAGVGGGAIPREVTARWPAASDALLAADRAALAALPIDHDVEPAPMTGGRVAGLAAVDDFLARLDGYAEDRNHPQRRGASGLSPWLHFGHISSHELLWCIIEREGWTPERVDPAMRGKRAGFWGMSDSAEAFLDELVSWRELGFNMCWQRDDYDRYESLPDWARATLEEHAGDPRDYVYSLDELEAGRTHDPLWNAAQGQLVAEGRIHNYLRMLWGKKIVEWTPSPRAALAAMIELNNKYAVDGRDPNSYSGIFWVLGRYDRAWGPERPVFGKTRYMSSASTRRKTRVDDYIARYAIAASRPGRPSERR